MHKKRLALVGCVSLALLGSESPRQCLAQEAPQVKLAEGGRALLPVIVAEGASPEVKQAATTLSQYLGQIAGANFVVASGDGSQGIAVGVGKDFPTLTLPREVLAPGVTQRENYLLNSHAAGIHLVGATPMAVRHAVWDLLYRLGHRQFFPGKNWEIVPRQPTLMAQVKVVESPDYYSRRIWYGFGNWPGAGERSDIWSERNRATSGVQLRTEHAYTSIIAANKAAFDAHPEYRARPGSTKLVVSNEGLRRLVIDHALAYFAKNPGADSISLEPSDLGGWDSDTNPDSRVFKSITDRVVTLANAVAEAVEKKYPGKTVGIYAYSYHAAPPSIKVHPNVVVSVATALIRGHTVQELVDGWSRQGATLGIREYYSVHQWDRDLPGRARGANLAYLKSSIPRFHAAGARYMSAESSDNWGPNGLGYYLAARLLWDVKEADRTEALVADFLEKSFGPAGEPMRRFYELLGGGSSTLFSEELVGQMYRLLDEALPLATDEATRNRIRDQILYVRYLELFRAYQTATDARRQAAFEVLVRYGYQIKDSGMIYSLPLFRDLDRRDEKVAIPKEAQWQVNEKSNPWKSAVPLTASQIEQFLQRGKAENKVVDFETPEFGTDLVPATPLKLSVPPHTQKAVPFTYIRNTRRFSTWLPAAGTVSVTVRSGALGRPTGVHVRLYAADQSTLLAETSSPADKEEHTLTLKVPGGGTHFMVVQTGSAGAFFSWPASQFMTMHASQKFAAAANNRWSMYFYVPRGTRVVGGFAGGEGVIRDADGKVVFGDANKRFSGYFSVPVAPGQDGRLWQFTESIGNRVLLSVPPYLAHLPQQLILPAAIVAADAAKKP